jgi:AcrR family transcriptional regulator
LIDDCTSRVPARLPFGCVHAAAAADVELPLDGVVVVAPDVVVALDVAVLDVAVAVLDDVGAGAADDDADVEDDDDDFFELLPQPASSATTAITVTSAPSTRLRLWRPKILIRPPLSQVSNLSQLTVTLNSAPVPSRAFGTNRRADAVASQEALVIAAADLYSERGPDVSYDEIACHAGVGRATLYRHFPTRELLLAGILEMLLDDFQSIAEALPQTPDRFLLLFASVGDLHQRNLPLIELLAAAERPPAGGKLERRRLEEILAGPLRDAQAAGLVRPELTPADARIVISMVTSLAHPRTTAADWARASEFGRMLLTP